MMVKFEKSHYTGKAAKILPLHCRACNIQIQNGETIIKRHTGNRTRYFCQKCWNKPILVYPLKMNPPQKPKIPICINNQICYYSGPQITSEHSYCKKKTLCRYKLNVTHGFAKTTTLTVRELLKMKRKYLKTV